MVLDGVGASLVRWIDECKITPDLFRVKRPEIDVRAFGESALPVDSEVDQTNARDDLVGFSLKFGEHRPGLIAGGRFAESLMAEAHEGIGSEHKEVRVLLCDRACLAIRIELANLVRRELLVLQFRDGTGDDLKSPAHLAQQIAASG